MYHPRLSLSLRALGLWPAIVVGLLALPLLVAAAPAPKTRAQSDIPFGTTFTDVATGHFHTCAIKDDGSAVCWGQPPLWGDSGQTMAPPGVFTQITAGGWHTCGLKPDGSVVCWGAESWGELLVPEGVFSQIEAGDSHTCGIKQDQTVACWGRNTYGQTDSLAGTFTQVTSGEQHTCGLRTDGTIACWGNVGSQNIPAGGFIQVSAGSIATCATRNDGSVACWGLNDSGQMDVPDADFLRVELGVSHACGIKSDGALICWGDDEGILSDVPGGAFTQLEGFYYHVCAIDSAGLLACWGDDEYWQIPHYIPSTVPAPADPPPGALLFQQVSSGTGFTCAITREDQKLYCWGENNYQQTSLSSGYFSQVSTGHEQTCGIRLDGTLACAGYGLPGEPDEIPDGTFSQVSLECSNYSCGIRSDNTLACWGDNQPWNDIEPIPAPPAGPFNQVDTGCFHVCGIQPGDQLTCWGDADSMGTLPGGSFKQVSASREHSCAIRTDGTLACWGRNNEGQASPPGGTFTQVSTGQTHSCAVRTDGAIICWGENTRGRARPPYVTFFQVSAGYFHTCGIKTNGMLACWGSNEQNQLPLLPGMEGTVPPDSHVELIVEGSEYRATITIPAQTVTDYVGLTYSSIDTDHFALVGRDGQQIPITQLEGLITVSIEYLPIDPPFPLPTDLSAPAETLKLYVRDGEQWLPVEELCQSTGCSQQVGDGTARMVIDYLGEFMLASAPLDDPAVLEVLWKDGPANEVPAGSVVDLQLYKHFPPEIGSDIYYLCFDYSPIGPVTVFNGDGYFEDFNIPLSIAPGLHSFTSHHNDPTCSLTSEAAAQAITISVPNTPALIINDAPHSAHPWPDNSLLPVLIRDHGPNTDYPVYFNGQPLGNGQGDSTCIIHTGEDGTGSGACGLPDDTQFSQFGVSFDHTYPITTPWTIEPASYPQVKIIQPQLLVPDGPNFNDASLVNVMLQNHAPGHRYHVFFGQGTSFTEIDASYPDGIQVDSQGNAVVPFYIPAYTSGPVSLHSQDANTPPPPSSQRQIATGVITVTIPPPVIVVDGGNVHPAGEVIHVKLHRHSPNSAYDLKFDTGYIDGDPSADGINPVYTDANGNAFNINTTIPLTMEGTKIITSFLATTGRYSATRQLTVIPAPTIEINGDSPYRPGDTITVTLRYHTPLRAYDVYLDSTLIQSNLVTDESGHRTFLYVIPADISLGGGLQLEPTHRLESRWNGTPVAAATLFIAAETGYRYYLPVILSFQ